MELKTIDLIMSVKNAFRVEERVKTAIYGFVNFDTSQTNSTDQLVVEDMNTNRSDSIEIVKSFNVIKSLIWACSRAVNDEGEEVDREE